MRAPKKRRLRADKQKIKPYGIDPEAPSAVSLDALAKKNVQESTLWVQLVRTCIPTTLKTQDSANPPPPPSPRKIHQPSNTLAEKHLPRLRHKGNNGYKVPRVIDQDGNEDQGEYGEPWAGTLQGREPPTSPPHIHRPKFDMTK